MKNLSIIDNAKNRLIEGYKNLPKNYFENKNASTYLFNNIVRLANEQNNNSIVSDFFNIQQNISLYFGVPWCEKICSFCNFAYSTSQSNEKHKKYLLDLKKEYELLKEITNDPKVSSIYFGGGTPTILDDSLFKEYLYNFINYVNKAEKASITCEFSTSTITSNKLDIMTDSGVTRISTGIQSLNDRIRAQANLVGSAKDAIKSVEIAQKFFNNFNIDLIYGHPYQSHSDWIDTVQQIATLKIPSITLYRLEVKERTSFKKIYLKDEERFIDEYEARIQYFIAKEILESNGYEESPLGWWVLKNSLAKKNDWKNHLSSWKASMPYFGLGQGAFSLIEGAYYENHNISKNWEKNIQDKELPIMNFKVLPVYANELNQLMRLIRTVKIFNLKEITSNSILNKEGLNIFFDTQVEYGLFLFKNDCYSLTEAGESLIHWIFDDLISFMLDKKTQEIIIRRA